MWHYFPTTVTGMCDVILWDLCLIFFYMHPVTFLQENDVPAMHPSDQEVLLYEQYNIHYFIGLYGSLILGANTNNTNPFEWIPLSPDG